MLALLWLSFTGLVGAQNYTEVIRDIVCTLPPKTNLPERASFLGGNVRLVFHDIAGDGGKADGCFDPDEEANAGLEEYSDALEPVFQKHKATLSRGDIWALTGQVVVWMTGGPKIPFVKGRVDCNTDTPTPPTVNDIGLLPTPHMNFHEAIVTRMKDQMNFTFQEIVALMGAHSLGGAEEENSGFEGNQVIENHRFTNTYYKESLGLLWKRNLTRFGSNGSHPIWISGKDTLRFDTDMFLVVRVDDFDGSSCKKIRPGVLEDPCGPRAKTHKFVQKYAMSQDDWFNDFTAAWQKMVTRGYAPGQLQPVNLVAPAWPSRQELNNLVCA